MKILIHACLICLTLIPRESTAGLLTGARVNEIEDPGSTTALALTCNGDSNDCASVSTSQRSLRTAPGAMKASLATQNLRIQDLGTGGVFIERCQGATPCEAIMTAPFFSQASLVALGLCEVESDPAVVRKAMNKLLDSTELGNVRAVLSGHSHHDHILDLPTVLTDFAIRAGAYGNRTMRNILQASGVPTANLIAMNEQAIGANTTATTWTTIPGQSIRFVAL